MDKLYDKFIDDFSEIWYQHILDNPDKPWDYHWLNLNPNINWEIVQSNPDKPWDYYCLSMNKMSKDPFFESKQLSYVLK